jgi:hypothetical protein
MSSAWDAEAVRGGYRSAAEDVKSLLHQLEGRKANPRAGDAFLHDESIAKLAVYDQLVAPGWTTKQELLERLARMQENVPTHSDSHDRDVFRTSYLIEVERALTGLHQSSQGSSG